MSESCYENNMIYGMWNTEHSTRHRTTNKYEMLLFIMMTQLLPEGQAIGLQGR